MWTPPYSSAVEGNTSQVEIKRPSFTVKLRLIDKGFYDDLAGILPTTPCQTGIPSYSCVDYRFPVTVLESSATPIISIFDSLSVQYPNARWKTQDPSNHPVNPTIQVSEGSIKNFTIRIEPYSLHNADLIRFGFKQLDCRSNGEPCPRRTVGFMLTEPSLLTGDFSTTSPIGSPISLTFSIIAKCNRGQRA
jgi:hypothetical protein